MLKADAMSLLNTVEALEKSNIKEFAPVNVSSGHTGIDKLHSFICGISKGMSDLCHDALPTVQKAAEDLAEHVGTQKKLKRAQPRKDNHQKGSAE